MKGKMLIVLGALLVAMVLILAACQSAPEPTVEATPCPTAAPCPTCPTCPECPACPDPVVKDVPNEDAWANSPHNVADAEAFVHWDEDDPKEVPTNCAKCHSTPGFQDYVGADGSAAGVVDAAAPTGTTIECAACHNDATAVKTSVVFPSGVEITGLGGEAVCMECHQGRASKVQVDEAIANVGVADDDTVSADLGFTNIHYRAAAATLYGTETKGGYEFEGKMYDAKHDHVEGYATCIACHDSHSLEVKLESCQMCHTDVADVEGLKEVREPSSAVDYDGDGDTTEGMFYEIQGLQEMLMQAIQAYGTEVAGTAIAYSPDAYPYFFADTNANGTADADEAVAANGYKSWTGRLLKSAYNYQMSVKDPGAFAHGNKYIVQLLHDSIASLNEKLASPVDLSAAYRDDAGHFAGNTEPFRHWDEDGVVPAGCVKCHTATGLPMFLDPNNAGQVISQPPSNGFWCSTCHDEANWPNRYAINTVTFPSKKVVSFGEGSDGNLCLSCHQGRESKASVDTVIRNSGLGDDEVMTPEKRLNFRNVHYFAAGATLFGTEAQVAYEYDGQTYAGAHPHVVKAQYTCVTCHDVHALTVKTESCAGCHGEASEDPANIRMGTVDYDGDGDTSEGVAGEIATMQELVYAAIQTYATETAGKGIVYSSSAYPYFFADADGDGQGDTSDNGPVSYDAWTPRLLRAAYNLQYSYKDPGAFAHNSHYTLELLYDSLSDLGGDVSTLTRAEPYPAE